LTCEAAAAIVSSMTQKGFEARLLRLWATTRVPLTRANLQIYTGAPRKKVERWLEALARDGVLEVDSDEQGELLWSVPGAARPRQGPVNLDETRRVERLTSEVSSAAGALTLAGRTLARRPGVAGGEQKSLVASGVLSFLFGPLGWLYAAPLREAAPAIGIYALVCWILPRVLLAPLLAVANPLLALAGVAYAWRYNQTGRRTSLTDRTDRLLPPGRR
jgi:winged helix DNA-binding protein